MNKPVPGGASRIKLRVEAEMTRLLYRSSGFGFFSNAVLALVLAVSAATSDFKGPNAAWLAAVLLVTAARAALNLAFKRADPGPETLPRWRTAFVAGVAASGMAWGAAGWIYFGPDDLLRNLLVLLIVAGLNSGAARSLASVPLAFLIYVVTTLGPSAVAITHIPGGQKWTLVFIMGTYAAFLVQIALLQHADHLKLYALIFEKEDLVEVLSREKARAEAGNRAKGEFLAMMSHEVRTPMNGILGMLQMLQQSPMSPEQATHVAVAADSAGMLLELLNDVLEISKGEAAQAVEPEMFNPAGLAGDVCATLKPRAEKKGLGLTLSIADRMPDLVSGEPVRLKRVLFHLVDNAVKFTDRGQVEMSIEPQALTATAVTLRFRFRDTGIGMDAETRANLFQIFRQGESAMNRRYGGRGLGLAISQRLVQQMGGEITVVSATGRGSEFSFALEFSRSPPARVVTGPAFPASPILGGRVLAVEDDRVNQRVITMMLERLGVECAVVDNGVDAVAAVATGRWNAVLMDCQMPGMDGFEATRQIRAHLSGRPLPIIALTANVRPEDRASAHGAGMDDFLAKPVRIEDLRRCLQRWLHGRIDPPS